MDKTIKLNNIGIVLRPQSAHIKPIFDNIKNILEKEKIHYKIDTTSSRMLQLDGSMNDCIQDFYSMCAECDMILSIGGDGTLISSARKSYGYDVPILGIHTGNLGFLTAILPNQLQDAIDKIRKNQYFINEHLMLELSNKHDDESQLQMHCVNEFLLTRSALNGMVELEAYIEDTNAQNQHDKGMLINRYKLDSLIVATPTGSSAYNISAGGSVVHPCCDNILITPVCSHSLTQKPLILDSNASLNFCFNNGGSILCDGQQRISIPKDSIINIKAAKKKYKLVQFEKNFYFNRLRDKFSWGK